MTGGTRLVGQLAAAIAALTWATASASAWWWAGCECEYEPPLLAEPAPSYIYDHQRGPTWTGNGWAYLPVGEYRPRPPEVALPGYEEDDYGPPPPRHHKHHHRHHHRHHHHRFLEGLLPWW